MHASAPPASTASASPRRINSAASPIACEPVELPDRLRRGEPGRVEILDLGPDPHRLLARVVRADEIDAAPALDRGLPGRRRVVSERGHRAEPRNGNPFHSAKLDAAEGPR